MDMSQIYMLMNLYQNSQTTGSYGADSIGLSNKNYLSGSSGAVQSTFRQILDNTLSGSSMQTPMDDIFEEAAAATGVSVQLLKAVGKVESNFNPSATSHCGAMGVMQLMPATARGLGVSNAYDARENIMGGARLLAAHLKEYNGDVKLALAAYNAGSGNVKKYGGIPPFKETQNYVVRVTQYLDQDISAGRMVDSVTALQNSFNEVSAANNALEFDYSQVFKLMMEQMKLKMDQKLTGILTFSDSDEENTYI